MRFRNQFRLAAAAVLLWSAAAAPQNISIQLEGGAFRVSGWAVAPVLPAGGWSSVFAVYAGEGAVPRMLGSYAMEGSALVFHPKFPLAPGLRYRAVFRGAGAPVERIFEGPAKDTRRLTRVEHVYPSGAVLPSNLLRFYVYFSAPMTQGEAGRRMRLLDENGKALSGVFLPGEELWDPEGRRLTMTLDPGRIKRGLTSNEAMGPPIVEGRKYTLTIEAGWPDARDVPLVEGYRKPFRGGPAERTRPDPAQWRIVPPPAGGKALAVEFPRPMNYVLLVRMLQVRGSDGQMTGNVTIDREETRWWFTPAVGWKSGDYQLIVDTALEDLAGNSIARLFDIDVFDRVTERIVSPKIALPFRVR